MLLSAIETGFGFRCQLRLVRLTICTYYLWVTGSESVSDTGYLGAGYLELLGPDSDPYYRCETVTTDPGPYLSLDPPRLVYSRLLVPGPKPHPLL